MPNDPPGAFDGLRPYDHGRLGVWAAALDRDAVWRAIEARRTWAITGDRIELAFALNGATLARQGPARGRLGRARRAPVFVGRSTLA